jgi:outer membrane protein
MRYRVGALGVLLVLASVSSMQAADVAVPARPYAAPASSEWIITVGGDVRGIPRYPGSNAFSTAGAPYFDMARPGSPEKFHGPIDGLGFALFDNHVFALGPVGTIIWPRDANDSSTINGLNAVNSTINVGGFVDYWAVPWLRSRAEVMQGFGAGNGVTARLFMDAVVQVTPAITISGGPRARYVTSGTASPYYSVSLAESTVSQLPVYHAGSGWQAVGAGTQLKYRFNPTWATYTFVEYEKLVGPSANSPIVTGLGGNANQWTFGLGLTYSFAVRGLPF